MKKILFKIAFILLGVLFFSVLNVKDANSWGFWAHKRINRLAVFTLPPEMIGFYKQHIEHITDHAVDPDKRRYALEGEDKRHYIDVDHYGEYPFKEMPHIWEDAVAKYSEDTLQEYGILPWNLENQLKKLTYAFEQQDVRKILKYSSDIGHYIGDGHVPLHTTLNYNGQLTGQKGIHGFWESRCPELFAEDYDFFVGKAEYIKNPNKKIWKFVLESASHVKRVFALETELTERFPEDKKYTFDERGQSTMRTYSVEFSRAFEQELDGMIESRMRTAILNIGSFWMTAWVNAGQPNLKSLGEFELTEEQQQKQKELEKQFEEGKIKGRNHSN